MKTRYSLILLCAVLLAWVLLGCRGGGDDDCGEKSPPTKPVNCTAQPRPPECL